MVTKVTDTEFNNMIENHEKVVIKFYANWCGICRLFTQKFTKISNKQEYKNILFLMVNAEENPEARRFANVTDLPFFATIQNGKIVDTICSSKEEKLQQILNSLSN